MRLGDLAERIRDPVPAGTSGPFIGLEHVVPHQLRLLAPGRGEDQASEMARFRRGDVLFGALRPGFRKVIRAPLDGLGSAELLVLRPRPGVPAGLLAAALAHPDTIAAAVGLGRGTRMPRVRWEDLADVEPPLPPRRAWARVGVLAEALERRLALAHAQEHRLTRILRAGVRQRISEGRGPRLGDVVDRRARTLPAAEVPPGTPVHGVGDLVAGTLGIHTASEGPGRSAKRPVRCGDVLLPRLRPRLRKLALAPHDAVVSPEIEALVPRGPWRATVVGRLLDPAVQAWLAAAATGTRMPRVPRQTVLDLRLGVSEADARALHAALDPALEALVAGVRRARTLRAVRDRVLADLLDGRLDPEALGPLHAPAAPRPTG